MGEIRKTIDGKREIEFPEGMSPEAIEAEMAKLNAQLQPQTGADSVIGNIFGVVKQNLGQAWEGFKGNVPILPQPEALVDALMKPGDPGYAQAKGITRGIKNMSGVQGLPLMTGYGLLAKPLQAIAGSLFAMNQAPELVRKGVELSQETDPVQADIKRAELATEGAATLAPLAHGLMPERAAPTTAAPPPPGQPRLPPGPGGGGPPPPPPPGGGGRPIGQMPLKRLPPTSGVPIQQPPPPGSGGLRGNRFLTGEVEPPAWPEGSELPTTPPVLPPGGGPQGPGAIPDDTGWGGGWPRAEDRLPPATPQDAIRRALLDQGEIPAAGEQINIGGTRDRTARRPSGGLTLDEINRSRAAQGLEPLVEPVAPVAEPQPQPRMFRPTFVEQPPPGPPIPPGGPTPGGPIIPGPRSPVPGPVPRPAPGPPIPPAGPKPGGVQPLGPGTPVMGPLPLPIPPAGPKPGDVQQLAPTSPVPGPVPRAPLPEPLQAVVEPQPIQKGKKSKKRPYKERKLTGETTEWEDRIAKLGYDPDEVMKMSAEEKRVRGIRLPPKPSNKGLVGAVQTLGRIRSLRYSTAGLSDAATRKGKYVGKGEWEDLSPAQKMRIFTKDRTAMDADEMAQALNAEYGYTFESGDALRAAIIAELNKKGGPSAGAEPEAPAGMGTDEAAEMLRIENERLFRENEELRKKLEDQTSFDVDEFGPEEEPPTGGSGSAGAMQVGPLQKWFGFVKPPFPPETTPGKLEVPPQAPEYARPAVERGQQLTLQDAETRELTKQAGQDINRQLREAHPRPPGGATINPIEDALRYSPAFRNWLDLLYAAEPGKIRTLPQEEFQAIPRMIQDLLGQGWGHDDIRALTDEVMLRFHQGEPKPTIPGEQAKTRERQSLTDRDKQAKKLWAEFKEAEKSIPQPSPEWEKAWIELNNKLAALDMPERPAIDFGKDLPEDIEARREALLDKLDDEWMKLRFGPERTPEQEKRFEDLYDQIQELSKPGDIDPETQRLREEYEKTQRPPKPPDEEIGPESAGAAARKKPFQLPLGMKAETPLPGPFEPAKPKEATGQPTLPGGGPRIKLEGGERPELPTPTKEAVYPKSNRPLGVEGQKNLFTPQELHPPLEPTKQPYQFGPRQEPGMTKQEAKAEIEKIEKRIAEIESIRREQRKSKRPAKNADALIREHQELGNRIVTIRDEAGIRHPGVKPEPEPYDPRQMSDDQLKEELQEAKDYAQFNQEEIDRYKTKYRQGVLDEALARVAEMEQELRRRSQAPPPFKSGGPGPTKLGPPLSKVKRPLEQTPYEPGEMPVVEDELGTQEQFYESMGRRVVPKPEPPADTTGLDPLTKLATDIDQFGSEQKAKTREDYQKQIIQGEAKGPLSKRELLGLEPKKKKGEAPLFEPKESPMDLFAPKPKPEAPKPEPPKEPKEQKGMFGELKTDEQLEKERSAQEHEDYIKRVREQREAERREKAKLTAEGKPLPKGKQRFRVEFSHGGAIEVTGASAESVRRAQENKYQVKVKSVTPIEPDEPVPHTHAWKQVSPTVSKCLHCGAKRNRQTGEITEPPKSVGAAADEGGRKPHQKEFAFEKKTPDMSEFHRRQREIIQRRSMAELVKLNKKLEQGGDLTKAETERMGEMSRRWRMATGKNPESTEAKRDFSKALRKGLNKEYEGDIRQQLIEMGYGLGIDQLAKDLAAGRSILVGKMDLPGEPKPPPKKPPKGPGKVMPFKKPPKPPDEDIGPGSAGAAERRRPFQIPLPRLSVEDQGQALDYRIRATEARRQKAAERGDTKTANQLKHEVEGMKELREEQLPAAQRRMLPWRRQVEILNRKIRQAEQEYAGLLDRVEDYDVYASLGQTWDDILDWQKSNKGKEWLANRDSFQKQLTEAKTRRDNLKEERRELLGQPRYSSIGNMERARQLIDKLEAVVRKQVERNMVLRSRDNMDPKERDDRTDLDRKRLDDLAEERESLRADYHKARGEHEAAGMLPIDTYLAFDDRYRELNQKLARQYKARRQELETGEPFEPTPEIKYLEALVPYFDDERKEIAARARGSYEFKPTMTTGEDTPYFHGTGPDSLISILKHKGTLKGSSGYGGGAGHFRDQPKPPMRGGAVPQQVWAGLDVSDKNLAFVTPHPATAHNPYGIQGGEEVLQELSMSGMDRYDYADRRGMPYLVIEGRLPKGTKIYHGLPRDKEYPKKSLGKRFPEGFIVGDVPNFVRTIWMAPEYILTDKGQEIVGLAHEAGYPVKILANQASYKHGARNWEQGRKLSKAAYGKIPPDMTLEPHGQGSVADRADLSPEAKEVAQELESLKKRQDPYSLNRREQSQIRDAIIYAEARLRELLPAPKEPPKGLERHEYVERLDSIKNDLRALPGEIESDLDKLVADAAAEDLDQLDSEILEDIMGLERAIETYPESGWYKDRLKYLRKLKDQGNGMMIGLNERYRRYNAKQLKRGKK